jgi:hypothetical protein
VLPSISIDQSCTQGVEPLCHEEGPKTTDAVHFPRHMRPIANNPPPASVSPGFSSVSSVSVLRSSVVGQPTPTTTGLGPCCRAPLLEHHHRGGLCMVSSQYRFLHKSAIAPLPYPSTSSPPISDAGLPGLPSCRWPSAQWRRSPIPLMGCQPGNNQPMLLGRPGKAKLGLAQVNIFIYQFLFR